MERRQVALFAALANFATTLEGPMVLAGHSHGGAVMWQALQ